TSMALSTLVTPLTRDAMSSAFALSSGVGTLPDRLTEPAVAPTLTRQPSLSSAFRMAPFTARVRASSSVFWEIFWAVFSRMASVPLTALVAASQPARAPRARRRAVARGSRGVVIAPFYHLAPPGHVPGTNRAARARRPAAFLKGGAEM